MHEIYHKPNITYYIPQIIYFIKLLYGEPNINRRYCVRMNIHAISVLKSQPFSFHLNLHHFKWFSLQVIDVTTTNSITEAVSMKLITMFHQTEKHVDGCHVPREDKAGDRQVDQHIHRTLKKIYHCGPLLNSTKTEESIVSTYVSGYFNWISQNNIVLSRIFPSMTWTIQSIERGKTYCSRGTQRVFFWKMTEESNRFWKIWTNIMYIWPASR